MTDIKLFGEECCDSTQTFKLGELYKCHKTKPFQSYTMSVGQKMLNRNIHLGVWETDDCTSVVADIKLTNTPM